MAVTFTVANKTKTLMVSHLKNVLRNVVGYNKTFSELPAFPIEDDSSLKVSSTYNRAITTTASTIQYKTSNSIDSGTDITIKVSSDQTLKGIFIGTMVGNSFTPEAYYNLPTPKVGQDIVFVEEIEVTIS